MTYNKMIKKLLMLVVVFSLAGCDIFDLDINKDPNNPSQASLDLLLANSIYEASELLNESPDYNGLNNAAHGFMRITTSFDTYNMSANTWNSVWNIMYSNPLKDLRDIKEVATEQGNNPHYLGIAQILEAYYFSIMVDMWGNVPFSEAFKGDASEQIKAASFDDAEDIYNALLAQIDDGIENLALPTPVAVEGDLIYGGDADLWTKFANSLKLKMLLNLKEVDTSVETEINNLVASGDLVDSDDDYAVFQFNASLAPDNRHPWYVDTYGGDDNAFDYIGHQFMVEMVRDIDPRLPFYLKRQTTSILDPNNPTDKQTIPCSQRTDCTYGYLVLNPDKDDLFDGNTPPDDVLAGYFGRDHGDPSGIPLDGALRTALGVYPVGGLYDDEAEKASGNAGNGNGVFPMITGWITKFHMIEAMLTTGAAGDPRSLFQEAMEEQIGYVETIGLSLDADSEEMDATEIDDYVTLWLNRYDAAGSDNARLNVVLKQAWFSNFGNGFEIYNAYRRTGLPNDLQVALQPVRGFPLRVPYTLAETNLNGGNVPDVAYDVDPIFWDVN